MRKVLTAILLVVVVVVIAMVMMMGGPQGPELSEVEHLRQPRVTSMPARRMLVVTAQGDPSTVARKAFSLLMKTYSGLKNVPKKSNMPAPRARWPLSIDTPREQWVGHYAVPLPDAISEVGDVKSSGDLAVELLTWDYGEVAEILHVGPYDEEMLTIKQLKAFIDERGYEIVGDHEEEYLRGPGMLFAGDPGTYLTIIRYEVRRK